MANAVPSRIGQANQAGAVDALFLKVFGGEVLKTFRANNVFLARTMVRTITSGKSASFPTSFKGGAGYHTPGAELNGTSVAHNERIITIDPLLVADRFLASIDEAMNHYDVRSTYTEDVGLTLATLMDQNIARVGYLTARTASNITGMPGGTSITAAGCKSTADTLISAVFDAAKQLDKNNVPKSGRTIFLSPDQYYLLISSGSKAIQRELNDTGANGSIASGTVGQLAGIPIVMTNNLPTTDQSADVTVNAAYRGDFSKCCALVAHKSSVGTVKLLDLAIEAEYQIQRQGYLIVGKYSVGHGPLRPEAVVEIKDTV